MWGWYECVGLGCVNMRLCPCVCVRALVSASTSMLAPLSVSADTSVNDWFGCVYEGAEGYMSPLWAVQVVRGRVCAGVRVRFRAKVSTLLLLRFVLTLLE